MLFIILYTLIEYLNVFLAYYVVFKIRMRMKKKIYIITFLITIFIQNSVLYLVDDTWMDVIIAASELLILIFLVDSEEKKWRLVSWFPILYLATSSINTLTSYLVAFFIQKNQYEVAHSNLLVICSDCGAILLILLVSYVKKNRLLHISNMNVIFNLLQYIAVMVGVLCFAYEIGFAQCLEEGENFESRQINVAGIVLCIALLTFIFVYICEKITQMREYEYKIQNEAYQTYIRQQEDHIKMLIEQDKKIRRFRHDFQAHITALEALAKQCSNPELEKYVLRMKNESGLYYVKRYTGVTVIDAVLNDLCSRAESKEIEIKCEGILQLPDQVEIFDLCTIFSNLITNAIEACEKVLDNRKSIIVKTYCYENNVFLEVRNTYNIKNNKILDFQSDKIDRKNHGFGSVLVKDTVKKYGGEIVYKVENQWVDVQVFI